MIFLYATSETFLSRAKVLSDSIEKYHPNDLVVRLDLGNGPLGEYIPNLARRRLEAALQTLEMTNDDVTIIGADCELFKPIDEAVASNADFVIVPHVKEPLKNRKYMSQIYQTGHANADFILIRNNENGKNILKWLISVTEDGMIDGCFYEQTWLSAVPFLFNRVRILKFKGYNVGYWDVNHIDLKKINDEYYIGNEPLVLFQYSGYVKGEPKKMSRHSKEECTNSIALEIYENYDRKIK